MKFSLSASFAGELEKRIPRARFKSLFLGLDVAAGRNFDQREILSPEKELKVKTAYQ